MAKESHKVVKFQGLIHQMWGRRTSPLLAVVGKKRMGPKAQFSKKYRTSRIQDLQEIAGEFQLPKLMSAIKMKTQQKTVRFSKGLRREAKWHVLQNRMSRGPHGKHLVYVIWDSRGQCSKVGRSDVGIRRLRGQRDAYYFRGAGSINLYFPKAKKRSSLAALECGLTHLFRPALYRVKPARRKYSESARFAKYRNRLSRKFKESFR